MSWCVPLRNPPLFDLKGIIQLSYLDFGATRGQRAHAIAEIESLEIKPLPRAQKLN